MTTAKETHYVYKITNLNPIDEEQYYIGVHTTKIKTPETDGYMGTSKYLDEAMNNQGSHNFKKEILSIWKTRKEALQEEIRLHELNDVAVNTTFYNRSKQTSTKFDTTGTKIIHSFDRNKKISEKLTGITHSKQRKENNRNAQLKLYKNGYIHPNKGKKLSDEHRHNISKNHAHISGKDHYETKTILIFDSSDNLRYKTSDTFSKFCEEEGLPTNKLTLSYRNGGSPIYSHSEISKSRAISYGYGNYIGWYAKIEED